MVIKMPKEQKQNFLQGTAILAAATLIVKLLSLLFTIPLANLISVEGMSYFYTAYEIFTLFLILSTSGVPVAVSKLVGAAYAQKKPKEQRRIFNVSLAIFLVSGGVCSFIMMAFSGVIANFMGNPGAQSTIIALAPTVFFLSVTCAFRGYFQGLSNMIPTATSQVIEAVIKIVVGVGLAMYIMETNGSDQMAATGAIVGVSISASVATIYLFFYKLWLNKREKKLILEDTSEVSPTNVIFKNIITFSIPIIIGSCFLTVLDNIDSAILMARLKDGAGLTESEALTARGLLGHAKKFFDLPTAFVVPISISLLPILSGAVARDDKADIKKFTTLSMRVTLMLSVPASIAMALFSFPISDLLLFNNSEAASGTAPILSLLSMSIAFNTAIYTTNTILQSFGKTKLPVINMAIGGIVKIILSFILVSIPSINVMGSPMSTFVGYVVILSLNLNSMRRHNITWDGMLKSAKGPMISAVIMGVVSFGIYRLIELFIVSKFTILIIIPVAVIIYVLSLFIFKFIKYEDVAYIPKGHIIIKLFKLKQNL